MSDGPRPDPARVAALFDAVLDLSPAEQATRIDAACAGDAALHEAVSRLVAHDRRAAPGFLAPPAALAAEALREQAALATTVPQDPGDGPRPCPTRLGRFTVLRPLGEGGMGAVYAGYDDVLDRHVALKLLHRAAEARAWLRREGQALARLAHPNVVGIHELGEHEGQLFLAMELVEGPTLRAFLEERRPPFAEVLRLFLQAGRGLAAAHDAGLVHRDFKPENVIVGADGRARVVDFGLATLAELAAASQPAPLPGPTSALAIPLTRAGTIVGTPGFMSPEQLRGERATPRSDQFSFCVALSRAAHIDEQPSLRPDAPRWLEPILRRGAAPDPAARFPSLPALIAAIERRLPRDPELDPSVIRRELQVVRLTVLVSACAFVAYAHDDVDRWFPGPRELLYPAVFSVVMAIGAVALRARKLAVNRVGRRVAALLVGTTLAVLAHRLIGLRLGLSRAHVLVEDMVVLTTIFGVGAITVEGWLGVLAAIAAAGVVLGTLAPAHAFATYAAVALVTLALLTADAFRRS